METLETLPREGQVAPTGQGQDGAPSPRWRVQGFGRTANTLLGYTFIKGLQLSLYNLIFPLYAYSLGYDQAQIGQLSAIGAVTVLLVSVPMGLLADRVGRARMLIASALIVPVTIAGIGLARSLPALIAWIVLNNALATIYWSTTSALLVGAVPLEQRVRAFATNSFLLWGLGALGSILGGYATTVAAGALGVATNETGPLRAALLVSAGVTFAGGLPLWRLRERHESGGGSESRARLGLADLRLFGRLMVPDALQAFGAGSVVGFIPLFFALRFAVPPEKIGLIFTLSGVLSGTVVLFAPRLARRVGDVRAVSGLQASVALCIAVTAASPFVAGAIGAETGRAALLTMVSAIYTPYAMGRVAPQWRGTLGGLYNVTYATGFSLGPLLSGWLQVHYGFGPAFGMGAISCLFAASSMYLFFGRRAVPRAG